jgi:sodium-independent sulfate anion transporter 11
MSDSKWKRGLAKGLGIQLDPYGEQEHRRQNHGAIGGNVDLYEESDGTTMEFVRDHIPSREGIVHYIQSLFPFWAWIFHYNLTWLIGDLVAG